MIYDRAATLTVTLLQIFSSSAPQWETQREIENVLREELFDIARQIAADRNNGSLQ
jgi:hypothetical protein